MAQSEGVELTKPAAPAAAQQFREGCECSDQERRKRPRPVGPEFREAHEETTALIVDLKSLLLAMQAIEHTSTEVLREPIWATDAGAALINLLSQAREKLEAVDRHHDAEWDAHIRERAA